MLRLFFTSFFVALLSALPLAAQTASPLNNTPILRQKTHLVTFNVSVVDKDKHPITGLPSSAFVVYEDKIQQQIDYFSAADTPVSIGIIFDVSASMATKLPAAQEAVKAFLKTCHPEDEFFLVAFNRQARLLTDYDSADRVLRQLPSLKAEGETSLYDAAYLGLEKLKQAHHKKRALIVISDGQDNFSRYNLRELSQAIKESDTLIYCLSTAEVVRNQCGHRCQALSRRTLEGLANSTGGYAFFPATLGDLENATTLIALELRQQYSIGYVSPRTDPDGKWHKISLQVPATNETARQKVTVRAKEGYYHTP